MVRVEKFFLSDFYFRDVCAYPALYGQSYFALLVREKILDSTSDKESSGIDFSYYVLLLHSHTFFTKTLTSQLPEVIDGKKMINKKITPEMILQCVKLPSSTSEYKTIHFHKDGTRMLVHTDNTIYIYNINTHKVPVSEVDFVNPICLPSLIAKWQEYEKNAGFVSAESTQYILMPVIEPKEMLHIQIPSVDLMQHYLTTHRQLSRSHSSSTSTTTANVGNHSSSVTLGVSTPRVDHYILCVSYHPVLHSLYVLYTTNVVILYEETEEEKESPQSVSQPNASSAHASIPSAILTIGLKQHRLFPPSHYGPILSLSVGESGISCLVGAAQHHYSHLEQHSSSSTLESSGSGGCVVPSSNTNTLIKLSLLLKEFTSYDAKLQKERRIIGTKDIQSSTSSKHSSVHQDNHIYQIGWTRGSIFDYPFLSSSPSSSPSSSSSVKVKYTPPVHTSLSSHLPVFSVDERVSSCVGGSIELLSKKVMHHDTPQIMAAKTLKSHPFSTTVPLLFHTDHNLRALPLKHRDGLHTEKRVSAISWGDFMIGYGVYGNIDINGKKEKEEEEEKEGEKRESMDVLENAFLSGCSSFTPPSSLVKPLVKLHQRMEPEEALPNRYQSEVRLQEKISQLYKPPTCFSPIAVGEESGSVSVWIPAISHIPLIVVPNILPGFITSISVNMCIGGGRIEVGGSHLEDQSRVIAGPHHTLCETLGCCTLTVTALSSSGYGVSIGISAGEIAAWGGILPVNIIGTDLESIKEQHKTRSKIISKGATQGNNTTSLSKQLYGGSNIDRLYSACVSYSASYIYGKNLLRIWEGREVRVGRWNLSLFEDQGTFSTSGTVSKIGRIPFIGSTISVAERRHWNDELKEERRLARVEEHAEKEKERKKRLQREKKKRSSTSASSTNVNVGMNDHSATDLECDDEEYSSEPEEFSVSESISVSDLSDLTELDEEVEDEEYPIVDKESARREKKGDHRKDEEDEEDEEEDIQDIEHSQDEVLLIEKSEEDTHHDSTVPGDADRLDEKIEEESMRKKTWLKLLEERKKDSNDQAEGEGIEGGRGRKSQNMSGSRSLFDKEMQKTLLLAQKEIESEKKKGDALRYLLDKLITTQHTTPQIVQDISSSISSKIQSSGQGHSHTHSTVAVPTIGARKKKNLLSIPCKALDIKTKRNTLITPCAANAAKTSITFNLHISSSNNEGIIPIHLFLDDIVTSVVEIGSGCTIFGCVSGNIYVYNFGVCSNTIILSRSEDLDPSIPSFSLASPCAIWSSGTIHRIFQPILPTSSSSSAASLSPYNLGDIGYFVSRDGSVIDLDPSIPSFSLASPCAIWSSGTIHRIFQPILPTSSSSSAASLSPYNLGDIGYFVSRDGSVIGLDESGNVRFTFNLQLHSCNISEISLEFLTPECVCVSCCEDNSIIVCFVYVGSDDCREISANSIQVWKSMFTLSPSYVFSIKKIIKDPMSYIPSPISSSMCHLFSSHPSMAYSLSRTEGSIDESLANLVKIISIVMEMKEKIQVIRIYSIDVIQEKLERLVELLDETIISLAGIMKDSTTIQYKTWLKWIRNKIDLKE
ncbi:hypothetical protein ADUPG1_006217 [Aduncisulcus paluster]|uniref:Uncharacterized protein n=1 Tax=Aduncisulcus paluster TaxID=2918883 RepID=A0ABQ5KH95_9EUKA|nr:hypothetical protein ADUPG1_006217 [Aduncisulcus paluster]